MLSNKFLLCSVILLIPLTVFGQTKQETIESLKKEIAELKMISATRFEKLENKLKELLANIRKAEKEDEMKRLIEKAKSLSQEKKKEKISIDRKFHSGLRTQSALNPNISLGGDYYFAYGTSQSDYNRLPSEVSWGTGQMFLREMEMGLQSALDPFSRAKVFISFSREGVTLEEGYMQLLNMPLDMNLKMGEYKMQFGKLNRYHDHAMPQFDRPLVLTNFFGLTSLKGFGIAANFLLPSITANVNELDLEVITGGVDQSFTSGSKHNLIFLVHFKNYYDLNRSTYFEVGLSGAMGNNDSQRNYRTIIGGADLSLKWAPPDRAKYSGIEWRTEILYSKMEQPNETINSWGFFSSIQFKLNAKWFASGRIDYSQIPKNNNIKDWKNNLEEKGCAVCFDYWQSEFVFFRFQYTYINRNFDENDSRFIFQTNWAMGPHKHEAY
jgi:hypothetical protein